MKYDSTYVLLRFLKLKCIPKHNLSFEDNGWLEADLLILMIWHFNEWSENESY